jgi:hypothetical protein
MPRHGKPQMVWTETDHPRVPARSWVPKTWHDTWHPMALVWDDSTIQIRFVFIHKIPQFANLNYAVGKIFPLYSPIGHICHICHICHIPTNYQHPWCTSYIHQWTLPLRYPLIDSTPTSIHIHWFIDSWIDWLIDWLPDLVCTIHIYIYICEYIYIIYNIQSHQTTWLLI